ncbi:MAG: TonB family protein [Hymenobacter sp.]|nr:MAG: TonB family protein [Hymenobacter sp.]
MLLAVIIIVINVLQLVIMLGYLQLFTRLSIVGGLMTAFTYSAAAQTTLPPGYTYVEKMPQLPGGGGQAAIANAIHQRIVCSPEVLRDQVHGRVFVTFTIAPTGLIQGIIVRRSLRADCDSAVVQAVRQLPRFEPGLQAGKPVAVSLTVPVTFAIQVAPPALTTGP